MATNTFFEWYYFGLGGIGGWLIFLILALAAVVWVFYDSQTRRFSAIGWRIGVIVMATAVLPTIMYRFTVTAVDYQLHQLLELYQFDEDGECPAEVIQRDYPEISFENCDQLKRNMPPMTPFGELILSLGVLGGILAPGLAIGYYITYQGAVGCIHGHIYDSSLVACPECAAGEADFSLGAGGLADPEHPVVSPFPEAEPGLPVTISPPRPAKPKVHYAWLVDITNERRYDLCQGSTRIGRDRQSDIVLTDPAVSRPHAQIREVHGHFSISDLGSSSGTLLNGKKLRHSQILQNGDVITIGDTELKFVTSL